MDNASGIADADRGGHCGGQGAAEALGRVPGGHRRGEGPARVALLLAHPHGPEGRHRRQRQHGHVPAALPAREPDGVRAQRVGSHRRRQRRRQAKWGSRRSPTRSRSGTASSAATRYSFIREGIPALALKVDAAPNSPEAKIEADWTRDRYHAPSDDLTQPIDRAAAAGFTDMIGRLALRVANRPSRPAWKADSFFKRFEKTPTG